MAELPYYLGSENWSKISDCLSVISPKNMYLFPLSSSINRDIEGFMSSFHVPPFTGKVHGTFKNQFKVNTFVIKYEVFVQLVSI